MTKTGQTAVIGAGLAGLTCARTLADAGQSVVIFDKSRGLGGRMATRRAQDWRFDHGAVALRPTADAFTGFLENAKTQGHAAPWQDAKGWTGLPGISGVVKPLAAGLDVALGEPVTGLRKTDAGWTVEGPARAAQTGFERVILAIPQPQALVLLAPWPARAAHIAKVSMSPCWTVMAGFDSPLATTAAYSNTCDGPLAVVARETAKPGRNLPGDGWVIQATPEWTRTHLEHDPDEVTQHLLAAFFQFLGCAPMTPAISMAHRWRYGLTKTPLGQPYLWDATFGLGLCGDWCLGDTAQAAFDSGRGLGQAVLAGEGAQTQKADPL